MLVSETSESGNPDSITDSSIQILKPVKTAIFFSSYKVRCQLTVIKQLTIFRYITGLYYFSLYAKASLI